jgi:hypothetical protein
MGWILCLMDVWRLGLEPRGVLPSGEICVVVVHQLAGSQLTVDKHSLDTCIRQGGVS